jgi:hypothetical protein
LGLDLQLAGEPWKQALLGECRVAPDRPEVQDFALEGARWISPGLPTRSLLYHLLAAPNAVPLLPAPSQQQIETLENCVYAAREFDLAALQAFVRQQFPACWQPLTVVVFAYEYRAANETPHGRCADLCYSRTGVARVGTVAAPYNAELRGYPLTVADQPFAVPVLPARYAAFLAVPLAGAASFLGNYLQLGNDRNPGDDQRQFWVPVHKLFPGKECLQGLDVHPDLQAYHVNEKLRRFHLYVHSQGIDTGRHQPEIDREPFIFTQQIAELTPDQHLGSRELMPTPHPKFVQPVEDERGPVTYWAPPLTNAVLDQECSAPLLRPQDVAGVDAECYPCPETIDAGHTFSEQQRHECLYHRAEVIDLVSQGNYEALHFHDFTGDGWIAARVRFLGPDGRPARDQSQPLLSVSSPPPIAAYSLVCAPDFLPAVGQRALQERVKASSLDGLQDNIWFAPPDSLADQRIPPNVELNHPHVHQTRIGPMFDPGDDTITAVVCMPFGAVTRPGNTNLAVRRNSFLPDQAAGLFSPGWDIGVDSKDDQAHLAMYSLGSPFPADSKLCAALSAFWPAVAPDTTRTFAPNQEHHQPTVVPLTDAEIGAGRLPDGSRPAPWDGVAGPELLPGTDVVDYAALENADYVGQAWQHGFDVSKLAQIDSEEYFQRLAAMFHVYQALGVPIDQPAPHNLLAAKAAWAVLSFQIVERTNTELETAIAAVQPAGQTNAALFPPGDHHLYFFDVYKPQMDRITVSPDDPRRRRVPMQRENGKPIRRQFYVGTKALLMCDGDGKWAYEIFSLPTSSTGASGG